ncbi:MAG: pyruvate ferredoxin oxidoreductase [Armatimonadota bacterium]|nr:MAG: pyruvate ferredoxin oxidoreductase [Armatimonadota bacterium]
MEGSRTDFVVRLAGESGEGVLSLGEMLTTALARLGYEVYTFRTYPAEIKGGTVLYQVRVADHVLLSYGSRVDVFVALNEEGYRDNIGSLRPGGVLIYDSDSVSVPDLPNTCVIPIPIGTIAKKEIGSVLTKNVIALGAVLRYIGAPVEAGEQIAEQTFKRKGEEVVQKNFQALHAGYNYVSQYTDCLKPLLGGIEKVNPDRLIINGNEALALGAIHGGLAFYAGYPITPATDIMEALAPVLPRFGGVVIQAEDEIAALGTVLGAAYAGKRAMTATSGPGFSLMVEQINLAAQAEIPAVIVDVQRGGASTGLPTKTAQGDLNIALYGVHNESPRVVMAPTSVEDCFYLIQHALNIAERYQLPVIVLSDQSLGHRRCTIPKPDLALVPRWERVVPEPGTNGDYARYAITETGISPMAIPGMPGLAYTATGIEHNEFGDPTYTPENLQAMKSKRFRKLQHLGEQYAEQFVRIWGDPEGAEVGIIGWGSTEGVIREAMQLAEREGVKAAALYPKMLMPLPVKIIEEFASKVKKVLVPEKNFTGEFAAYLRSQTNIHPISYAKDTGLPFDPEEVKDEIIRIART